MATEGEQAADGVAEDLQNAAEGVLEKAREGDSAASAFIHNVAHVVQDQSSQAADSSKAYIQNVVQKVQDYAHHAAGAGSESTADVQEAVSRAVHVGATPATSNSSAAASGTDGGFLTSVATWCSSLCGSRSNAAGDEPAPRAIDFQAAAENVAQVLHSSTTSSDAIAPAEVVPEEP